MASKTERMERGERTDRMDKMERADRMEKIDKMDRTDVQKILSMTDHTILKQNASVEDIYEGCEAAVKYKTTSFVVPPYFLKATVAYNKYLDGTPAITTVVGFPNGYNTLKSKLFEASDALENGAEELDMVINISALLSGMPNQVYDEIATVKELVGDKILKVIIETSQLTKDDKILMCNIITQAGADYIKTSTGFSGGGATVEDILLFKEHIGPGVKIKASGGIRDFETARKFIDLGVSRIGSSSLVELAKTKGL